MEIKYKITKLKAVVNPTIAVKLDFNNFFIKNWDYFLIVYHYVPRSHIIINLLLISYLIITKVDFNNAYILTLH